MTLEEQLNKHIKGIDAICKIARDIADEKGFETLDSCRDESERDSHIVTALALVSGEVSEAIEELRLVERRNDKHLSQYPAFDVELADVIIRTFNLCARLKINIGPVIRDKMIFNSTREFRHGNKRF